MQTVTLTAAEFVAGWMVGQSWLTVGAIFVFLGWKMVRGR